MARRKNQKPDEVLSEEQFDAVMNEVESASAEAPSQKESEDAAPKAQSPDSQAHKNHPKFDKFK